MDNANKFMKEVGKAIAYLIFIYPLKWLWQKIRGTNSANR